MLKQIPIYFIAVFIFCFASSAAEAFRVATYNVENYLDQPTESRHFVKSAEAKAKIRESIKAINPDVLALEEIGTTNALLELRASLKAGGLDFPFWEYVRGFDTNIHVVVLSRLPIVARRPHTNEFFSSTENVFKSNVVSPRWTSKLRRISLSRSSPRI